MKTTNRKITKIISFVLFLIFGVVIFVAFPVWLISKDESTRSILMLDNADKTH